VSSGIPEVVRLFIAGILAACLACSDANDVDSAPISLFDCMEDMRDADLCTPDSLSRSIYICSALSRELPFALRAKDAWINVKGIACDFARMAGFDCGFWYANEHECAIANQVGCWEYAQLAPCFYESCLARIPQYCAESAYYSGVSPDIVRPFSTSQRLIERLEQ